MARESLGQIQSLPHVFCLVFYAPAVQEDRSTQMDLIALMLRHMLRENESAPNLGVANNNLFHVCACVRACDSAYKPLFLVPCLTPTQAS